MADQPQFRIENHTAHVKHLALGNGQTITVPPTEEGQPGLGVNLENPEEQKSFDRAIDTAIVKKWIEDGELVINRGGVPGAINTATSAPQGAAGQVTGAAKRGKE